MKTVDKPVREDLPALIQVMIEELRELRWQKVQSKEVIYAMTALLGEAGVTLDKELALAITACVTEQPVVFSADVYLRVRKVTQESKSPMPGQWTPKAFLQRLCDKWKR